MLSLQIIHADLYIMLLSYPNPYKYSVYVIYYYFFLIFVLLQLIVSTGHRQMPIIEIRDLDACKQQFFWSTTCTTTPTIPSLKLYYYEIVVDDHTGSFYNMIFDDCHIKFPLKNERTTRIRLQILSSFNFNEW